MILLAYIMLLIWPLVTMVLYVRKGPVKALVLSSLGAYLLLPSAFEIDLPGVPPLGRESFPAYAFLACYLFLRKTSVTAGRRTVAEGGVPKPPPGRTQRPKRTFLEILVVLLVMAIFASLFMTYRTNGDELIIAKGKLILPGLGFRDFLSMISNMIATLLPFVFSLILMRTESDRMYLLKALVWSAVLYTPLILVELRMSPQIHTWTYGYFQHSFAQHIRNGSWRPLVFTPHGLRLAIYIAMATIAAIGIARILPKAEAKRYYYAAAWLYVILFLCNSLGAFILATAYLLPALLLSKRGFTVVAGLVGLSMLVYPVLRTNDLVPLDRFVATIERFDADRASSFEFRLEHEDKVLRKWERRSTYGWGGWGRGRIYSHRTGEDLSVTDGTWILELGGRGSFGYAAVFGLICLPLLAAYRHRSRIDGSTAILVFIISLNLLDLIPNSSDTVILWLLAGAALAGCVQLSRSNVKTPAPRPSQQRVQPAMSSPEAMS